MRIHLLSGLLVLAMSAAPQVHAKSSTFVILNSTGATLTAIYGGPSSSEEWSPNFLQGKVGNGDTVSITISEMTGCAYDFKYDFSDRESYEEFEVDICEIDGAQFEIK